MTSLIEKIVAIIAPNRCVSCSNYNNILCTACHGKLPVFEMPFCLFCGKAGSKWQVCAACMPRVQVCRAYAVIKYAGVAKAVVRALKFEHVRQAADPLAYLLHRALPHFNEEWLVVPVPTATSRIRQRSYDQVLLVARQFAAHRSLAVSPMLGRYKNVRQVGASRSQRQQQAQNLFYLKRSNIAGSKVILIDDVCTTGATLNSATQTLLAGGASEVVAVAVAWQAPKKT